MPKMKSLVAVLICLAVAAPACSSSDCDKAYDMMKKCAKGDRADKIDKSAFVTECQKALSDPKMKEEAQEDLACMKEDSCEKVETCAKAKRGKARAKKITEKIAAGKWKDAFDDCTLIEEYYSDDTFKAECNKVFANADKITGDDMSSVMFRCQSGDKIKKVAPDFEKACKTLASGQLAAFQKAATAARDAGKNDFKVCLDLKKAAELAGAETAAAAQKQCDEMAASEEAKKAADEARSNATAKKTSVPYQCDSAAEKLEKLDTDWAKKRIEDVYKACYVELGQVVIAEKGKDAKYVCPYEITKITDGIKKHELVAKFPELADVMKKLPAKCQK